MAYFKASSQGLLLYCQLQPRSSRDAIAGIHNGRLKIQITAPPVDGKANEHLLRFIAKAAGVAKSQVSLESGHTGKLKTLLLAGVTALPPGFPEE